jgi:hypothetical protein
MMKQRNKNMTDEEYRQLLENDVDLKLKEAELEKQYAEKLEKILSPRSSTGRNRRNGSLCNRR